MTIRSYFWTTSATPSGQQVKSYGQDEASYLAKVLANAGAYEGVVPGFMNEFREGGGNSFEMDIDPGAAVVDGVVVVSDEVETVPFDSTPYGRVDLLVLRVTWSTKTAEFAILKGTTGTYPNPPTPTQTPGTLYELPLFRIERKSPEGWKLDEWRPVQAFPPQVARLTRGRSVAPDYGSTVYDSTKFPPNISAGEKWPSSTNWGTNGSGFQWVFNSDAGMRQPVFVQAGSRRLSLTGAPGAKAQATITFPEPYWTLPYVIVQPHESPSEVVVAKANVNVLNLTPEGFDLRLWSPNNIDTDVHWLAFCSSYPEYHPGFHYTYLG